MKVIAATSNPGKLREIVRILSPLGFEVIDPPDVLKVEETGSSFLENALIKAKAYFDRFGMPTVADDSGLEVEALRGYPGVYSSRFYSIDFGGQEEVRGSKDEANVRKLLRLLKGVDNRRARFVAWVVLYTGDSGVFGYGECRGTIAEEPRGSGGFGYDPVFVPEGYTRTMAEIPPEEKDRISHRGAALRNLVRAVRRISDR